MLRFFSILPHFILSCIYHIQGFWNYVKTWLKTISSPTIIASNKKNNSESDKKLRSFGINSLRWFITLLDRYKAGDEKDKQMGRTRDKLIVLYCHWQYLSSTKYTFPHILSTAFVYFSCFLIKLIKIKNYYVSIACIKVKRKHSRFTSLAPCTVAVHFCIRIRIKRHNFLIEFMCESIQKVRVMCIAMR